MAIRSSAQLNAGRDDDRLSPGFKKESAAILFGGMVVTNLTTDLTGKTLKIFGDAGNDGIIVAANPFPLGLVFENTLPFSPPASGDEDAGVGFDIQDFAKGGLYSVFHRPGNFVDVFDDQRSTTQVTREENDGTTVAQNQSAPFIIANTWAIGAPVYSTEEGLLTTVIPAGGPIVVARIGFVRSVSTGGSPADLKVTIELQIAAIAVA